MAATLADVTDATHAMMAATQAQDVSLVVALLREHPTDRLVQEVGCGMLCVPSFAARLSDVERVHAADAALAALRAFKYHTSTGVTALAVVSTLCDSTTLLSAGAVATAVSALHVHASAGGVDKNLQFCCVTVRVLMRHVALRAQAADAPVALVSALRAPHATPTPIALHAACTALNDLCCNDRLFALPPGALSAVVGVLRLPTLDPDALVAAVRAFIGVCSVVEGAAAHADAEGLMPALVANARRPDFFADADLQALLLVSVMTACGTSGERAAVALTLAARAGVLAWAQDVLRVHLLDEEAAASAVLVLLNTLRFGSNDAYEAALAITPEPVLAAMRAHPDALRLQAYGCMYLKQVAEAGGAGRVRRGARRGRRARGDGGDAAPAGAARRR
jgi:hypothetical protein